jgi:hypothetical protein
VWNPRSDWVISDDRTHSALVGDAGFLAVQQITALAVPADGRVHRYQLTGLLVGGLCGRRLEGHWVNRRPGYRCRHDHPTAQVADTDGPGWVYWSQARIVEHVVCHRKHGPGGRSSRTAGEGATRMTLGVPDGPVGPRGRTELWLGTWWWSAVGRAGSVNRLCCIVRCVDERGRSSALPRLLG